MKNLQTSILAFGTIILFCPVVLFGQKVEIPASERARIHYEVPDQPYLAPTSDIQKTSPAPRLKGAGFFTTQVNVDASGNNIVGDAANEPSIAVDPTNPANMIIGWRQFDNVNSNFRQAGFGYSSDGGQNWTFPGVIEPGIFRSDPVLDFDTAGNFYYNSLTNVTGDYTCDVFKSSNGGATWDLGTAAHGGDKQWMTVDRTGGPGSGNIYSCWNSYYTSCYPGFFTRSANAGASFENCLEIDGYPYWGTMEVGPEGELYITGGGTYDGATLVKSTNAQFPGSTIAWNYATYVDLDGYVTGQMPINPVGILGQVCVDVDRSDGSGRGNVYVLASVVRLSLYDPADVMFAKSTDGGATFGTPKRLNTDESAVNYQWFGTMSVAPNGRIDVIWLDTRDDVPGSFISALYYCYSDDQGETWSINKKLSDQFDPTVGYPQQDKMGDYFDMVSDNEGAHLAWANTFNGEQDVYYAHIVPTIVGMNEKAADHDLLSLSCSPNPFRDQTTIRYKIPGNCIVKVVICDLYGNVMMTPVEKSQTAGTYTLNLPGGNLPAGFYICRISAGSQTKSIGLVKLQ